MISDQVRTNETTLLHLCEDHLRFIGENIYLPSYQICFTPREVDFAKFQHYPQSSYQPNLLSRQAYFRREEYKDDLRRLNALYQAISLYTPKYDIYLNLSDEESNSTFFLPRFFTFGKGLKVPAGEKVILLGYPSNIQGKYREIIPNSACLFPGKIITTPEGSIYSSFSLEESLAYLDKISNYNIETSILNLDKTETLETLKNKLITYLRIKIKSSLRDSRDDPRVNLYQLTNPQGELPLEVILERIIDGTFGQEESLLLREFPLIFTPLTQEVTLYINDEKVIIGDSNNYNEESQEGKLLILNPILASEERNEKYTTPVSVEMRALHLNYAYQLINQGDEVSPTKEPIYEDFLGEANWLIAPITIFRSNDLLRGKVESPPYFFEDVLNSPSKEASA
jgi:hypothetical protein